MTEPYVGMTAEVNQSGQWLPFLITHVLDDGRVSGVGFSAHPDPVGFPQSGTETIQSIVQGEAHNEWRPYYEGESEDGGVAPGAVDIKRVADEFTDVLAGMVAEQKVAFASALAALPKPAEPAPEPTREEQIDAAVRRLDPAKKSLFTQGGLPRTEVVEAILGFDITAGERDASVARVQAGA